MSDPTTLSLSAKNEMVLDLSYLFRGIVPIHIEFVRFQDQEDFELRVLGPGGIARLTPTEGELLAEWLSQPFTPGKTKGPYAT